MRFLIRDKISLKGRHFILAEKRGIGSRPDIPQDISAFSLFLTVHGVKRSADISFQHIVQFPAFTGSAVNLYFFQASVLIEGDTAVEKKIPVIDLIQSAFIQKKADMFLQSLAVAESRFQTIHNILLAGAQLVGMLPVYRWETCIQKRIFLPVRKGDGSFIRIDPVEKAAVLHMEFLPSAEKFSLQFELDHGDRLVHLAAQFLLRCAVVGIPFQFKSGAGIVLIYIHCKRGERDHVDPVSILQYVQIIIADAVTDHSGDTGLLSRRCSHPHHVMISPLDIQRVIFAETLHNEMGTRSSVINIAKDMKMIHDQPLDQLCKGNDEVLRPAYLNNGIDNRIVIGFFVQHLRFFRDQFFDHIGVIRRKRFTDLGTGVLGRRGLAHLDQPVQSDLIPVLHILFCLLHQLDLLSGIIDQRRQRPLVAVAQRVAEHVVDLLAHSARAVPEHMGKSFVFSMKIRHKMFRPLRQVQNRLEIDDLCRRLADGRI